MQKHVRTIVDAGLVLLFVILMLNQATGIMAHEILGASVFILFLIHHILNRNFYRTMWKGNYTKLRIAFLVVDIFLFLMMILMVMSSLMISQYVFSFLPFQNHMFGRMLHIVSAYSIYLLSALHLGLHFHTMIRVSKDKKQIIYLFLILFALVFGIQGFIKKEFIQKLTLQNLYPLYTSDSVIMMIIDYVGVFLLFVMIGYGIYQILIRQKRRNQI